MFSPRHEAGDVAASVRFAVGWVDSDRVPRFNGVNFVFKCYNLLSRPLLHRQCLVITIKHDITIASERDQINPITSTQVYY